MVDVAAVVKSIVRDHIVSVEVETDDGYRYWSKPMPQVSVQLWIRKNLSKWESVSDVDCTTSCWCTPEWMLHTDESVEEAHEDPEGWL